MRTPNEMHDDLVEVLEQLLSQLSLGPMNNYVRAAYINANNVLNEYQQAMDQQDAEIKADMEIL